MALGLGLLAFFCALFSPAFVQSVKADEVSEYGTVIGIVSWPRFCPLDSMTRNKN